MIHNNIPSEQTQGIEFPHRQNVLEKPKALIKYTRKSQDKHIAPFLRLSTDFLRGISLIAPPKRKENQPIKTVKQQPNQKPGGYRSSSPVFNPPWNKPNATLIVDNEYPT